MTVGSIATNETLPAAYEQDTELILDQLKGTGHGEEPDELASPSKVLVQHEISKIKEPYHKQYSASKTDTALQIQARELKEAQSTNVDLYAA